MNNRLTLDCTECDTIEKDAFLRQYEAIAEGWRRIELAGTSGPWLDYAFGLCPNCSKDIRMREEMGLPPLKSTL